MRYRSAAAFRQALEQRLHDHAHTTAQPLVRLRKTVAFDRLLARLLEAAPDRWVLKGALALDLRLAERGRTTMDMDLVHHDDAEAVTEDLLAAARLDLGDFFVFSVERLPTPAEETGAAVRFRARAELAGRVFEEIFVDVGFSDPLGWDPEPVSGSGLLAFAEIPRSVVPAVRVEQQVAEKIHAYTRTYGTGVPSSRVKDLVDLVVVAQEMELDAERLREALVITFEARGQHPLPTQLPPPPSDWSVPYRKAAVEMGIDGDEGDGHAEVARLIDPVLAGQAHGRWEPRHACWLVST